MRKKNIIYIIFSFVSLLVNAQMPHNGDYSSWNWENTSSNNWQRAICTACGDIDSDGDGWINLPPPFLPTTKRVGNIVDVYNSGDYTKAKGWSLVWAQFDGIYPFFVMYNLHKGIVRVFFYLDSNTSFKNLLATISYHDVDNPGILAYANTSSFAQDKYLNGTVDGSKDNISVIILGAGPNMWCCADFPMFLDENIQNTKYNSKQWVFQFYGCDTYDIHLKGKLTPITDIQQTITGATVSASTFDASYAKIQKQISSSNDLFQKMKTSVKDIDQNSPKFARDYKAEVTGLGGLVDASASITSAASGFGAILGFMSFLTGTFDNSSTPSVPVAVPQAISLEGTMAINKFLSGNTVKIPGVNGSFQSGLLWTPFNCPLGIFNLRSTPTIQKTTPYLKYLCSDAKVNQDLTFCYYNDGISYYDNVIFLTGGTYPYVSGYKGKIVKYKFNDDVQLIYNNLPGLSLLDVHFAIVGKPQVDPTTSNLYYKVDQKELCYYAFVNRNDHKYNLASENPVYHLIDIGYLTLHKLDSDNNDQCFGTPFLEMNQLKGAVLEVPENTDMALRIVARFTSDKYSTPIVFMADYKMDEQVVSAAKSEVYYPDDQSTFPFNGYYLGPGFGSLSSQSNTAYAARTLELNPGFIGDPGFSATALNIFPQNGNTIITPINFYCTSSSTLKSVKENASSVENAIENKQNNTSVFPNPNDGVFKIENSSNDVKIQTVQIVNISGIQVYAKININSGSLDINLSEISKGIYFVKVINSDGSEINKKIIIN